MKKTALLLSVVGLAVLVLAAVMVRSCRTGDAPHRPTGSDVESTTSQATPPVEHVRPVEHARRAAGLPAQTAVLPAQTASLPAQATAA